MQRILITFFFLIAGITLSAQTLTGTDTDGNLTGIDQQGNSFNPNRTDTTKKQKEVPKGIYVWRVDRKLGDIIKADVDTVPHLYPQSTMAMGTHGAYNTTGSNYTPRLSRIFIDRKETDQFLFVQPYSQVNKTPDQILFTNTLSPITNLSYDNCGNKQNGEDHIDAKFAVNAGKRLGFGFDLDYDYARGYYQNQSTSHFNAILYASYMGDRYQMHTVYAQHHRKVTENGGILNDNYITHPELFTESYSENEIPVLLSSNWNRNDSHHLFLTHRYNVGFYRKVKMTDEEIEAKKFAEKAKKEAEKNKQKGDDMAPRGRDDSQPVERPSGGRPANAKVMGKEPDKQDIPEQAPLPADTTRLRVDSKNVADSLLAIEAAKDSAEMYMKKEFVPVTSFIHTLDYSNMERIYQAYSSPTDYYANTYFPYAVEEPGYTGDSIKDNTRHLMLKNTAGIALLEGFNKWAKAGLKAFVTHEYRHFDIPSLNTDGTAYMDRWVEHNISLGGRISKTQGNTLHYDLTAETWLAGEDFGQLKIDFATDLNFPLWGDTVHLAAKGYLHRLNPTFYERHYHGKHMWWDNDDLGLTTRLRAEGVFAYDKTNTRLRVALEELQNYTYFAMSYNSSTEGRTALSASVKQSSSVLHVLTAQLDQKLALGPLHWDNVVTYQTTSDSHIIPLPTLNIFSNLYLKFLYARVLTIELGGAATYFTDYYAPDFIPQLNQFAVQENSDSKVTLGNFPILDVYANLHLKHARFFVMMTNVLGTSMNRRAFLTPHYPLNVSVFKIGVSWNFFN